MYSSMFLQSQEIRKWAWVEVIFYRLYHFYILPETVHTMYKQKLALQNLENYLFGKIDNSSFKKLLKDFSKNNYCDQILRDIQNLLSNISLGIPKLVSNIATLHLTFISLNFFSRGVNISYHQTHLSPIQRTINVNEITFIQL